LNRPNPIPSCVLDTFVCQFCLSPVVFLNLNLLFGFLLWQHSPALPLPTIDQPLMAGAPPCLPTAPPPPTDRLLPSKHPLYSGEVTDVARSTLTTKNHNLIVVLINPSPDEAAAATSRRLYHPWPPPPPFFGVITTPPTPSPPPHPESDSNSPSGRAPEITKKLCWAGSRRLRAERDARRIVSVFFCAASFEPLQIIPATQAREYNSI
jgi:hypothetical protein